MRSVLRNQAEVEARLAETKTWLDQNEGSGVAEEGVMVGWEQALEWALQR